MKYFPHRMNTDEYLKRIGYAGEVEPTLALLRALQEAHLKAIPFENLDIHGGTAIVLDVPRLYRKIVSAKRGGFCYELNGLFHWLLQELGFDSRLLSGQVYDRTTHTYGPDFDHMLGLTKIEGRKWIVDVGFGDFSMQPLEFAPDRPLTDPNGVFLIERETDEYYRVSRYSSLEHQYDPQYRFSQVERQLPDFAGMCLFHQTSPHSHFTRNAICSIATETGRITLADNKLIITENGKRTESLLPGWQEYAATLARYFAIHWSGPPLKIAGFISTTTGGRST